MPRTREEGSGGRCFGDLNTTCTATQICFVIEASPAIASFNRRNLECACMRAYIEIPFREGSSERNQVAAYIVSQIGQNAQSVQTTAESHLRCSRRNRYRQRPAARRRPRAHEKGLHLAMKAFYFVRGRLGAAGEARPARRRRCVTARRERVTSLSRPAPSRSRASSGRLPAHPTSLPRRVRTRPCDPREGATPAAACALPLPRCVPAIVRA